MGVCALLFISVFSFMITACAGRVPAQSSVFEQAQSSAPEPTQSNAPEPEAKAEEPEQRDSYSFTVSDLTFSRDGKKIFGKLYVPEGEGRYPAVVMGHPFGANLSTMECYAEAFAKNGIIAYAFDFIGGGQNIQSDGTMEEMSVLTEAADMNTVFDGIRALDQVDEENMYVMGASQGGFVATYVAGKRPEDVKGLIALYPAYVLQDDARKRTNNGADMKDSFEALGNRLGRIYDEDALSFDIYDVMKNYNGNALIIHGTADTLVPYEYAKRASGTMKNADLITIEGAGHGFNSTDNEYATDMAVSFIKGVVAIIDNGGVDNTY